MAGSTNVIALVPTHFSGYDSSDPLLWIWYTLGGRLGPAYREWVLYDTTCRTRWLRQIARVVVQVVLPAAVVLAVLGVTWIVWAAVGLGLWILLYFVAVTALIS